MLNNFTEQYPYFKEDLTQMLAYDGDGRVEYVGFARPGTATATAAWQIHKLTYDVSGQVVSRTFAGKQNDYNQVWDVREELDYA